jgi:hypothetical protein
MMPAPVVVVTALWRKPQATLVFGGNEVFVFLAELYYLWF